MTTRHPNTLFQAAVWQPALEKFAQATRLTVVVYGSGGDVVVGPIEQGAYEPGVFEACARRCLTVTDTPTPTPMVASSQGFAVVGTPLVQEGHIVGAAVAGTTAGVPEDQLALHGALLQALGDLILRSGAGVQDNFLDVLSHALRTPLTPILLWTTILKSAPDRVAEAVTVIERNARHQARLVDDLLDLSRVERGVLALDLDFCDLGQEVRSAVDAVRQAAREEGLVIHTPQIDPALQVAVDCARLQRVLYKVLDNAIKFTPRGGSITVTVARNGSDGMVTITDTGEGIAPRFVPFVFEVFRSGDGDAQRRSGLGVGLAFVKRIVELHGGDVSITSPGVDRGAEVVLRLPLIAPRPS